MDSKRMLSGTMEHYSDLLRNTGAKRFLILALLVLFLYVMRNLIDLFLFTFIITYLMYRVQQYLSSRLRKIVHIEQRILVALLYAILAATIALGLYRFLPELISESMQVLNQIAYFYRHPPDNQFINLLITYLKQIDFLSYFDQGFDFLFKSLGNLARLSLYFFLAVILSLYFLLERSGNVQFMSRLESSSIAGLYLEIKCLGSKFVRSFGKVIEAQIMIAFVNSVLSVIALWIMGFPQVLGLGIMILVLGLIPVAGVIISLVPLSIIAFSIGGIEKIAYVVIMITILHALESYVLNPRLVSSKTKLPVFFTLLVLIVAEHFMGAWGLIIGIPIFMFILDVLEVSPLE